MRPRRDDLANRPVRFLGRRGGGRLSRKRSDDGRGNIDALPTHVSGSGLHAETRVRTKLEQYCCAYMYAMFHSPAD
jgi:hypothetical protein